MRLQLQSVYLRSLWGIYAPRLAVASASEW
jgi:hypothetical protein